jgi:hypothetical protein
MGIETQEVTEGKRKEHEGGSKDIERDREERRKKNDMKKNQEIMTERIKGGHNRVPSLYWAS